MSDWGLVGKQESGEQGGMVLMGANTSGFKLINLQPLLGWAGGMGPGHASTFCQPCIVKTQASE